MLIRDEYHPNYKKQYSGEHITPEVLSALKQSDRKMEYMEVDLKREGFRQNLEAMIAEFIPSREDSYERLQDEEKAEFLLDEPTPEDKAIHNDELERLHRAMEKLKPEERALIHSLFYEQISEAALAEETGITQQGISWRLHQILAKLKNFMNT